LLAVDDGCTVTSSNVEREAVELPLDEYRALYRKYRPQAPDEVLGQEHVVRALAGAVTEGKLAHAFLFSGPRGTGKTSSARILAKMVNCEQGPTATPCGKCEQCVRIREGTHLDVWEIDAASHGGVDDARELRERAPTAPAQGREKVYIIDEAQRLSREAFDALLKLLEEPPPGVRFVLATTEPHKMPPTIVGRCQKFEFRRIPADTIAGHLARIAQAEDIALAPEAAEVIARESEGSVRDALSLLDQAVVLGAGKVTDEVVTRLIGAPEAEVRFSLADAVAVGDAKGVFGIIHGLVQEGQDLRHLTTLVTGHFRDLLLTQASPDDPAVVDVPADLHPRLVAQAGKFSPGELDRILGLLLQAQTDMRWSTAPRLTLELALVRAALPETDPQPAALLGRIERLERLAGLESPGAGGEPSDRLRGSGRVPSAEPASEGKPSDGPRSGATVAAPAVPPAPVPEPASTPEAEPTATRARDAEAPSPREAGGPAGEAPGKQEAGAGAGATRAPGEVGAAPEKEIPATDEASRAEPRGGRDGPTGGPHAPAASAVGAEMLRRDWPQVVEALKGKRRMIAYANAQAATVGSFDGTTLELVLPPGGDFRARKLAEKSEELREVLLELFGISPAFRYTIRTGTVVELEAEETPTPEAAEELVRQQFGAEVVEED
jgi:DNA polymerase-3 subunit gamma/tau